MRKVPNNIKMLAFMMYHFEWVYHLGIKELRGAPATTKRANSSSCNLNLPNAPWRPPGSG
eukprot:4039542-Amphidinium_carterae.1